MTTGARRVGFPGDAYVLALVGGTGVGKSSLLNALAGGDVSRASALRPTTAEPIAWIPRTEREALEPLLDWLDVRETREHETTGLGSVAILDLPDMDSVAGEHRARVEALLPLVDAVAWVTDHEKYADAVLHDEFLRSWLPRLGRQVVLVNKADRVTDGDARRIQRDLAADLASGVIRGSEVAVLRSSAVSPDGTGAFRAWLDAGAEAKRVVRGRIAASLAAAAWDLAWAAGAGSGRSGKPLLDGASRAAAVGSATEAVLRVIDLPALERQAVAATRAKARARGAGPLGRLTSLVYRTSGRETAVADPNRFLLRWRERGQLGSAVEAIRSSLSDPIRTAPSAIRPALAATLDPGDVARSGASARSGDRRRWRTPAADEPLVDGVRRPPDAGDSGDRAVGSLGRRLILVRPVTGSIEVPVLGPIPSPFVALVVSLLGGYLIARLLGAHAGWLGHRWAAGVRGRVAEAVEQEVQKRAFSRLDELERARVRLSDAVADIERSCPAA